LPAKGGTGGAFIWPPGRSILEQRRDQIFPKLDRLDIERVRRFGDVRLRHERGGSDESIDGRGRPEEYLLVAPNSKNGQRREARMYADCGTKIG
jgi:hypothetical protein